MAADPIAAAANVANTTYADAQNRTAAGKQALLDQLASQGTYGKQVDSAVQQANVAATAPTPTNYGTPALNALAGQGAAQQSALGQQSLAAAAALAAVQRQQNAQTAATYFDSAAAALPLEQSRAQSEARTIMDRLIQEREDRANRLAMQQLEMQATRERMAADRAARATAEKESYRIRGLQAQELDSKMKASAFSNLVNYRIDDETGEKVVVPTRQSQAAELIIGGMSPEQAFKQVGLSSKQYTDKVIKAVNDYNTMAREYSYFEGIGRPDPGVVTYTPAGTPHGFLGRVSGV